jgi:uncharacterized surface protein with fasciclin (FAS1) repeats
MRSTFLGVSAAAIGIGLAATGCSSGGNSAAIVAPSHKAVAGTKSASSHSPMTSSPNPTTHHTIGDACSKMPTTGMGSISGMASAPTATAVANNPQLTVLTHAIAEAGLTGTLNSATAVTLFAPDDAAFHALGGGNLKTLIAHKADLTKLLEYHIVKGRVTPAHLAAGKPLLTLVGLPVHPVKSGKAYKVNGALVTCGNIQTANGSVYIVDRVLIPTP